ncbi:hypothetical protein Rt10032_c10g4156 [Rhodotorula toruloides]|uniref:Uncharacterized protein n=1 Tax=Rhodotorula toruloides TaxID=5286 RepID=A0A511KID3_RHOTO|nr:hypothetical protein Rt10032_c10g4156 [Rhodotorula toruloides]
MFCSSLASLLTLAVIALNANPAQAEMSQGDIDPMNDWHLRYDRNTFATTETFCRTWRTACVDLVGPLNEHHQLDCRFSTDSGAPVQQGTTIWAKCGGKPKSPDGTWKNALPIVDRTRQLARTTFAKSVHIISEPVLKARCVEFQKKNKSILCNGAAAPSVTKRTTTLHKPTSAHKTTSPHKATTTHKVTTTHKALTTHKHTHKTSSHKLTTTKKPAHPTHKRHEHHHEYHHLLPTDGHHEQHHEHHHLLPTKRVSGLVKKVAAKQHEKH